jgi:hypothetical protein
MPNKTLFFSASALVLFLGVSVSAQNPQTYSHAITDRLIHKETPMSVPDPNVVFTDPDFGSSMVRVTDASTNFRLPNTFLITNGSGEANEWSKDSTKFYLVGDGGWNYAFAFDPKTMAVSSLPNATPGEALLLPLRAGATFSSVDSDLIYGTSDPDTLTIQSYRFSTGITAPVIDTRTCSVQPPLGTGPSVVSDDGISASYNDRRLSIAEGGKASGAHMFVIVYDQRLGCRWYNTQTGQIGGPWGKTGSASVSSSYLIRHAYLSASGEYVVIEVANFGWYVWNVSTLNVTACAVHTKSLECGGYLTVGFHSLVNSPDLTSDMQDTVRSLGSIDQITQLVEPPLAPYWGQIPHFTWNNANSHDSTPVCASTHTYDDDTDIDQPFAREILCIETDGLGSTIWRFAHNRAAWTAPHFNTQPLGTVSQDGRFFIFTSNWEGQLGPGADGLPRSDVFILKLE